MSLDDAPLTPERWRRIQALYHDVVARRSESRASALAAACPDDPGLAAAVQLLLDQPESAAGFLSHPALGPSHPLADSSEPRAAGSRLGHFELLELAGMGGMGEVYRARDTKLQRTVAIKVLPAEFTNDPERVARFEREARVLASLNHPNIGTLYGVEEAGDVRALVLEFVEGETLAARIHGADGSALPLADALSIAKQIADGLEAAHERGFIHRDLKPANIMITPDGAVKVLDFGLAKLGAAAAHETSESATATRGGTRDGAILGTAAYMSPEQARGKPLDRRTDIWAFGCVLYEMLTGRQAFGGETTSDAIAGILGTEPDWTALPGATPAAVRRLLERCLRKDPRRRLRDMGDAIVELSDAGTPDLDRDATKQTRGFLIGAVVSVLVVTGLALGLWRFGGKAPIPRSVKFPIPLPPGGGLPVISPDGRLVAYVTDQWSRTAALWVRPLAEMDAVMLPGTEGARGPLFWSPDSRWIGFASEGRLKKIDTRGGAPQFLADLSGLFLGGAWNRDGTIIFSAGVIHRVSDSGGAVSNVTELDPSLRESAHTTPSFLPDGRHFLYQTRNDAPGDRQVYIGSIESKSRKRLMDGSSIARYAAPGFVLYGHAGALMARPFDPDRMEFTGEATTIAGSFDVNPNGLAPFNASDEGTLAYRAGGAVDKEWQWSWLDRTGKNLGPVGDANKAATLRLSPDGKRVAFSEEGDGGSHLWTYDTERGLRTRLTSDPSVNHSPIWSPDGSHLVFDSNRNHAPGIHVLYQTPANGATPETLLLEPESGATLAALDWSRDGRLVLFVRGQDGVNGGHRLEVLPLSGDRKPVSYVANIGTAGEASLSPNGRWVAYTTTESGLSQVVVRSFPDPSVERKQISANGGAQPRWRGDGKELYYLDSTRRLVAVELIAEKDLVIGKTTPLFETPFPFWGEGGPAYPWDVSANGQRFLVSAPTSVPAVIVLNWAPGSTREK